MRALKLCDHTLIMPFNFCIQNQLSLIVLNDISETDCLCCTRLITSATHFRTLREYLKCVYLLVCLHNIWYTICICKYTVRSLTNIWTKVFCRNAGSANTIAANCQRAEMRWHRQEMCVNSWYLLQQFSEWRLNDTSCWLWRTEYSFNYHHNAGYL